MYSFHMPPFTFSCFYYSKTCSFCFFFRLRIWMFTMTTQDLIMKGSNKKVIHSFLHSHIICSIAIFSRRWRIVMNFSLHIITDAIEYFTAKFVNGYLGLGIHCVEASLGVDTEKFIYINPFSHLTYFIAWPCIHSFWWQVFSGVHSSSKHYINIPRIKILLHMKEFNTHPYLLLNTHPTESAIDW